MRRLIPFLFISAILLAQSGTVNVPSYLAADEWRLTQQEQKVVKLTRALAIATDILKKQDEQITDLRNRLDVLQQQMEDMDTRIPVKWEAATPDGQ